MLLINHKTKNKVEMLEKCTKEREMDGRVCKFTAMVLLCAIHCFMAARNFMRGEALNV